MKAAPIWAACYDSSYINDQQKRQINRWITIR